MEAGRISFGQEEEQYFLSERKEDLNKDKFAGEEWKGQEVHT